jgi:hypothetical protein
LLGGKAGGVTNSRLRGAGFAVDAGRVRGGQSAFDLLLKRHRCERGLTCALRVHMRDFDGWLRVNTMQ